MDNGDALKLVPSRLVERRKNMRLTQAQLAAKVYVSIATVRRWELGRAQPSVAALDRLSKHLHTAISYLLGTTDIVCVIDDDDDMQRLHVKTKRSLSDEQRKMEKAIAADRNHVNEIMHNAKPQPKKNRT